MKRGQKYQHDRNLKIWEHYELVYFNGKQRKLIIFWKDTAKIDSIRNGTCESNVIIKKFN